MKALFRGIRLKNCLWLLFGSLFLAFGLYNVHALSGVTEGGLLGLDLLAEHWLHISPAITNFVLSTVCYFIGWKMLGREFIVYSAVAAAGFSAAYKVFELFDPLWPGLYETPLLAALLGAVFVGVGTGICVRNGGALCGDDALAMAISRKLGIKIEWVYLVSDLTVLGLSLTYIPLGRIVYSLLTVVISGRLIGLVERFRRRKGA